MANTLSIDEIEPQFGVDRTGFTFKHNGAFFRAINDNAIPHVRKLLASGLIQRLIEEDLFPETSETTLTLDLSQANVALRDLP